jgi:enterochelin esterase-like enzyme
MPNRGRALLFSQVLRKWSGWAFATVFVLSSVVLAQDQAGPLRFRIKLSPELLTGSQSGRLILFLSAETEPQQELRREPGETYHSMWMAAEEIRNLRPGETFNFEPDRLAWPTPLSKAPPGDYQVMAVLDVNHHYAYNGLNPGDLRSEVIQLKNLDPRRTPPLELSLTKRVPQSQIDLPSTIEIIDFTSPLLSRFWGKPIHMRGVVVLPPSYARTKQSYATAYLIPGFASDLAYIARLAPAISGKGMAEGVFPEMFHVALDESCPGGTHEFADSVNNGPWGQAFTQELIPYLESKYRMISKPSGRFLSGHPSGGWAVLWLLVNYPEVFGGAWPTAPDSPDFRNFYGANLRTNPPENLYYGVEGATRAQWLKDWAQQDRVLGDYGGLWSSFEWVFSPRGNDGRPQPLFDRETGTVEATVAKAWERYDIAEIVRRNADHLRPLLDGKIHLTVGTTDTFGTAADRLLEQTMKETRIHATFTYVQGRGHFDLDVAGYKPVHGGLLEQIFGEMDAAARHNK